MELRLESAQLSIQMHLCKKSSSRRSLFKIDCIRGKASICQDLYGRAFGKEAEQPYHALPEGLPKSFQKPK